MVWLKYVRRQKNKDESKNPTIPNLRGEREYRPSNSHQPRKQNDFHIFSPLDLANPLQTLVVLRVNKLN